MLNLSISQNALGTLPEDGNIKSIYGVQLVVKLSLCYLEHLDCLGLIHANRLKSWVGGCIQYNLTSVNPVISMVHTQSYYWIPYTDRYCEYFITSPPTPPTLVPEPLRQSSNQANVKKETRKSVKTND
jgi:hypothetical protein